MRGEELARLDASHVWHPYAPLPPAVPPLVVRSAQGVRLRAEIPGQPGSVKLIMSSS